MPARKVVACASTGNTAASLAAYAARAGLTARVYLPAGQVSLNKLAQALDFGAEVVEIEGSFDDALNTLLEKTGEGIYFLNSINPFRIEGQKTTMFELLDQLDWKAPDYLVVPGGNLGNSAAFGKAFDELLRFGLIDRAPRMIVVQAAGANPFAQLWRDGDAELTPVAEPETIATAIRIGNPRSWKKSLRGSPKHRRPGARRDRRGDRRSKGRDRARRHRLRASLGRDPGRTAQIARRQQHSRAGQRRRHPHRSRLEGYQLHYPRSSAGGSIMRTHEDEVVVRVPGSIANLGPGFDTLAVAVQLYLTLHVRLAPGEGELRFEFVNQRLDGENYIERAFRFIAARHGFPFPLSTSRWRATFP